VKRLDLELLRQYIRKMKPGSKVYKVLKEELKAKGHWRNKKRGISKVITETGNTDSNDVTLNVE